MTHIAILGAGITGVTTAYDLARRGYRVTVFDRQRYAAMETSYANGGQLSASNAEVWTTWATVLKGLKWMLKADAPLLVSPRPSWHKLSWMAEFLSNIPNYRANTVETVRMALAARGRLAEMAARSGVAFDLETRGILHVYQSARDLAAARKVSALYAEGGLERVELSEAEARQRVPQWHGPLVGGVWTESDMTGDIHKFSVGLANWLAATHGVAFRYGTDIAHARADAGGVTMTEAGGAAHRFDGVVVAAGVASRRFAAELGDRVNIYPVKGYSITVALEGESRLAAPWVSLLDDKAKIVTSRLGEGRLRVAGTAEFAGENRDIRADRIRPLVSWVEQHFPGVSTERAEPWAGLRPMLPSMLPRVGRGRHPRVFYNTGHGHLGWTLAGATAGMVGDVVAGALPAERVKHAVAAE